MDKHIPKVYSPQTTCVQTSIPNFSSLRLAPQCFTFASKLSVLARISIQAVTCPVGSAMGGDLLSGVE